MITIKNRKNSKELKSYDLKEMMRMVTVEFIPIDHIVKNEGQIEGLPANPRVIKDDKYQKLKKSIEENPEMLALREVLVYLHNGEYIAIGGNMRLAAMKELGYKEIPAKVIPEGTTIEQLKAYTIKDNSGFGEWNWDMLANEWDAEQLADWGVDSIPDYAGEDINLDSFFGEQEENAKNGLKIAVQVPEEYKDILGDIKEAIKLTLEEWKGCEVK